VSVRFGEGEYIIAENNCLQLICLATRYFIGRQGDNDIAFDFYVQRVNSIVTAFALSIARYLRVSDLATADARFRPPADGIGFRLCY